MTNITREPWVLNQLPGGDGEIWSADQLLTELKRRHPEHLQPGDPDTQVVRCPDCGQTEVWVVDELADHGMCRTTGRCECDEYVESLPRYKLVAEIDLGPELDREARDDIIAALEALTDITPDPDYIMAVNGREVTFWREIEEEEKG